MQTCIVTSVLQSQSDPVADKGKPLVASVRGRTCRTVCLTEEASAL